MRVPASRGRGPAALRALLFLCAFLASLPRASLGAAAAGAPQAASTLRVGALTLTRCTGVPGRRGAYCGRIERPLDPAGTVPGRLSIYFELYPATGPGSASGMLVATEGGPGYPATQSRDEFLALFEPLRRTRAVLIMDNRGTGRSGALDCPQLQAAERWTTDMVGACGDSLGERAALFGTALAADDLAAILTELRVGKIDLYGDSYGTYFEQVFALRHPWALRSVVLDGAYALNGPDYAWYPSYAPAMRDKFNLACRRSTACAKLPGSSLDRIIRTLAQLRLSPAPARAADADGKERVFTADPGHLATVMFGSDPALATVRELDAAARAYLDGDRAPLLRLMAETIGAVDSADARNSAADITQWSAGLEVAVMCHDPPQIFDMRLPPALRAADRDRALAGRRLSFPDTYAPFTIEEYRAMPLDYSYIDQCVSWPISPAAHPAGHPTPPNAAYPDVPALVISGELDNMTTPADGAAAVAAFPHGKRVLVANSFHVNALPHARSPCAANIVRQFIDTLQPGNTGCASQVPPVRLVPRFALHADEVDAAVADAGNAAPESALRVASAAAQTVGDILVRAAGNSSGHGVGLRGGRFDITEHGGSRHVVLDGVRWTEDLAVSGTIDQGPDAVRTVHATISINGPDGIQGSLGIRWEDRVPDARAELEGMIGDRRIAAHMTAP
ncbi:MAG TPA: alpha/beta hydrolase [Steroidobacteraceae bacterium]|nr:alpha/beta hydrolase [Steroidobacteraceae bacterium]